MTGTEEKKIVLPEGEYADYLATLAANIADERIAKREQKWRTITGLVITALAVLGFVNLSSIRDELAQKVDTAVQSKLPGLVANFVESNKSTIFGEPLEQVRSDLETRIAFVRLLLIAEELGRGSGFTEETRDAAVTLITIVSENSNIVSSSEFSGPLEKILDAFLRANQSFFIDQIETSLGERMLGSKGITLSMVQHYGMKISGSVRADEQDIATFQKYATAARERYDFPEATLPFELMLDFISSEMTRTSTGASLLQNASHLEPSEIQSFVGLIDILRNGEFYETITGEIERTEERFATLYDVYREEIEALRITTIDDPESVDLDALLEALMQREGSD